MINSRVAAYFAVAGVRIIMFSGYKKALFSRHMSEGKAGGPIENAIFEVSYLF